ncbi:conserved protein of unknown function [Magnetospirillum gryphiswaldense MSR-1 v2]|uniref:DUF1192 domain-containing protein n=1 Tax=Magnetospirillum gryphiswaldense (strain DSM 6361 / JCM 21280 / NBRC 15271 / MSR-1) TaxID=431944 RepID=V6EYA2_MAGGM|nr:DUF1192 domain-containing protein [Magnetospirillum gryphiswaldense]CDK98132.1 conserved protein of unknown function [Magnetospirillum gryphiswaldense MSR-1 v2]
MDVDDLDPKKKTAQSRDLGTLGVEELRDYIAQLQAEIIRAEATIAAKEKVKSGAEALFRKA